MGTPPETPLTLLLFCRSLKIDNQRSPEEREDHTNQRRLREKRVSTQCHFLYENTPTKIGMQHVYNIFFSRIQWSLETPV